MEHLCGAAEDFAKLFGNLAALTILNDEKRDQRENVGRHEKQERRNDDFALLHHQLQGIARCGSHDAKITSATATLPRPCVMFSTQVEV